MKKLLLLSALLINAFPIFSQKKPIVEINKLVTQPSVEAPLAFLSADEMRGRDTGSRELDIAANYIASQFHAWGLKTVAGADKYFQPVELHTFTPVAFAELKFKDDALKFNEQFLVLEGVNGDFTGEFIFVGYGSKEEMPADIRGKMVVSIVGSRQAVGVQQIIAASSEKFDRVKAAGGAGLIEYFVTLPFPWQALVGYFTSNARTGIKKDGPDFPHVWMKDSEVAGMKELKEQKKVTGSLNINAKMPVLVPSRNVVGMIEGTDPVLKNEYLVISAHYDHVGVGVKKGQDSIYNGARDNALGTVGMMTAARFFSQFPPKRSVLFIALTGEEKGLLGSAWYAEHPLVPLAQTIFDLDCDGAGYNDKSVATVIGLERTSAEADISKACSAFGLKAGKDPVPEQNLYERSDNYNFAKKGIPAVDFAPGIKAFDAELMKYYHQPADEVGSLDFEYLVRFYKAFVYANYLIANGPKAPTWTAGDKYEAIGKSLYNK
ncbi:MAG: M28 family peptidase [Cyclobacteriaceae bacterium]|nr:M28 family peptidase [Cyclobacteriaceae bacterium]